MSDSSKYLFVADELPQSLADGMRSAGLRPGAVRVRSAEGWRYGFPELDLLAEDAYATSIALAMETANRVGADPGAADQVVIDLMDSTPELGGGPRVIADETGELDAPADTPTVSG
jgi:hypothetical protein